MRSLLFALLTAFLFLNVACTDVFETKTINVVNSPAPVGVNDFSSLLSNGIKSCGDNWSNLGLFTCDVNGAENQEICGCLPPFHDDPASWINLGGSCFTHKTGRSCVSNSTGGSVFACGPNWPDMGDFSCDSRGLQRQTICGCNPDFYDDPRAWINLGGACYTHITGNSCAPPPQEETKLFGYYAGGWEGMDGKSHIPDLSKSSNFVMLEINNLEAKLSECERSGVNAMVSLHWIFMDEHLNFRADWQAQWNHYSPALKKHRRSIVAFYGLDEPYLNGREAGKSDAEIFENIERMGNFLKSEFPEIPIAVIFSARELGWGVRLPPSHDWFGLDCYNGFDRCEGRSIPEWMDTLKSQVLDLNFVDNKNRFLMAVPPSGYDRRGGSEDGVLEQLPRYKELVKNEPMIKVVMPFVWQSFDDGRNAWRGVRELPTAREEYIQFFHEFTGR